VAFWGVHYEDRGEFEHDLLIEGVVNDPYEPVPLETRRDGLERDQHE
jgi:hypothetical protein